MTRTDNTLRGYVLRDGAFHKPAMSKTGATRAREQREVAQLLSAIDAQMAVKK